MYLADKPVRNGEATPQATKTVLQRCHVVGYFHHIVHGDAGCFFQLEQQEIGEGRLSTLDLRGKQSLLANICVKEEMWIGQQGGDAVEASQGQEGSLEENLGRECPGQPEAQEGAGPAQRTARFHSQRA